MKLEFSEESPFRIANFGRHYSAEFNRGRVYQTKEETTRAASPAPGLDLHPYQVAAPLGKQLRFSASIEEVSGELQNTINKSLPTTTL